MDVRIQTRYSETVTPRLAKAGGTGPGISPELTPADWTRRAERHSSHDARCGNEMQAPAKARGDAVSRPIGKGSVRSIWSEKGMSNRKPISKRQRWQILERDGFKCRYCGRGGDEVRLEIDHMKPVAGGGCNCTSNLVTACFECNRGKGVSVIGSLGKSEYERMVEDAKAIENAIRIFHDNPFLVVRDYVLMNLLLGADGDRLLVRMAKFGQSDDGKTRYIRWLRYPLGQYIQSMECPT